MGGLRAFFRLRRSKCTPPRTPALALRQAESDSASLGAVRVGKWEQSSWRTPLAHPLRLMMLSGYFCGKTSMSFAFTLYNRPTKCQDVDMRQFLTWRNFVDDFC
jgi:hypothetical protein